MQDAKFFYEIDLGLTYSTLETVPSGKSARFTSGPRYSWIDFRITCISSLFWSNGFFEWSWKYV